ncbi:hypothetical protein ADINL_2801 [Nitrincola lacisaponensis]|uniref:Uncharacterized protein n=1 Tax=Nitrincola lacisaponensis TaxID=267850 RepID=A0A063Y1Q5_9GAMM|nr:hypothetical protein [Nitrincola lacisaponensis]KDE38706.1 hypothetical protein ADINL_2801 [Nitrincola lacisaponensis]
MHQHRVLLLLLLLLLGVILLPPIVHATLYQGPVWLPFALWASIILLTGLFNHTGKRL